jgi:hypothetical protein
MLGKTSYLIQKIRFAIPVRKKAGKNNQESFMQNFDFVQKYQDRIKNAKALTIVDINWMDFGI